ncbi:MAG: hydrogenase nickel incorporation protein HypB [Desulfatitalea sp.]|nr:hydrogenase nickel incorporation protein HypB [Desulfatitalea sp.]NNK00377.1 hydrogenase nickel incorporation protein HypB [Desulfatitalea sp.]
MNASEDQQNQVIDIPLDADFLQQSNALAAKNRKLLDDYNMKAFEILGSVGAGKTSLAMQLVDHLKAHRIAVIAGDLTTTIDADRIKEKGAKVIQVNTGRECHLDPAYVLDAMSQFDLAKFDLMFIENVGNLICPADFKLGADKRIVVVSVTEGPYTVLKHPYIFLEADLVVINKIDLAEAMKVNVAKLERELLDLNPNIDIVRTNLTTGEGVEEIIGKLEL